MRIVARNRTVQNLPDEELVCPIKIGYQWVTDFTRRQSDTLKTGARRHIDDGRADVSMDALRGYYDRLKELMDEHQYPGWAIANMDETMLKVASNNRRAVFSRGMDAGYVRGSAKAGHITLVVTIFANGKSTQPLVILENKNLPQGLSQRVAGSFSFIGQEAGWMTAAIFEEWAKKVFVPKVEKMRDKNGAPDQRVLLLVDGHGSRACPAALHYLAEHNIDVVTPVSHSSHICQPLDLRFFAVFKQSLSGMRWRLGTQPLAERRNIILEMAVNAIYAACRQDIILRSFALAGIFPFDPSVPLEGKESHVVLPTAAPAAAVRAPATRGAQISEQLLTSPEAIAAIEARHKARADKAAAATARAEFRAAATPTSAPRRRRGRPAAAAK